MRSTCDAAIADTVSLTVRFESSCSPMELDFPEDNWIVNANSGDELEISVSGYDRSAFNNILLQSSPSGQNSWSTSRLITSDEMPNNRATVQWDVSNLDDGEYDFRVAVQCDEGITYTSHVSGSIRRSGLLVEGIPSPSDDILNIGDVINVTFNRNIEPSSVVAENVRLVDLSTGEKIPLSYVVSDRRVTITPEGDLSELQNRLLQASLRGVVDMSGNPQVDAATWTFRVRQNPIAWNSGVLRQNILLGDGDGTILTAELTNQAAEEETFTIVRTPEWLDAITTSGTLQPEESRLIAFTPDPLLGAGMYRDTVVAETSLGNENLIVEYGIQCEPPAWDLDTASFSNSMNLVADFYIEDVPFSKENDIVAAYVGDELRGVSRVVPSIPADTSAKGYLYTGFLTIFSNQSSGEDVSFRIWDSAACQVMDIANTLEFQSDAVIGSADSPEQFTVSGAVLQSIPMQSGNNWISLGVEATNMSVNIVLSRVCPRDGDVIISQGGFNQYVLGAGWVGRIDSLDPGIMYKMILENESSLDLIGEPVDGDDRPISVNEGWNWIGYLPDQSLPVSDALPSLSPAGGDIIRSQTAFSQYSSNSGSWEGDLSTMSPGAGYKLRRSESGTLTYPSAMDENNIEMLNMSIAEEPGWEVNAADYEQVMAVTGRLTLSGDVITGDSAWLSAWIDGELRGVTRAVKVLDQWLYFMNINGDSDEGEPIIEFKDWHPELGLYEDLSGSVTFNAESVIGSPREPIELLGEVATSSEETFSNLPVSFELNLNYPNPFNPTTQIDFALPEASDVRLEIFNVIGQRVSVLVNEQRTAGYHNVRFDASGLASGVYFYRIHAGSFVKTQKMMLLK
ncbi:T9SS type A sorting domain-containing protein [Rhodohalobacter sp. 8-1]|uniref:T9SS type A sorting domain-containing protein n=1 Tax=Rhodohalobacter sp. 8-1 TaxID=3131972 RepID=UPI0030EF8748